MKLYIEPAKEQWNTILKRPTNDSLNFTDTVRNVLQAVREKGDQAVAEYTLQFDKVALTKFEVTADEFIEAEQLLNDQLKTAILTAYENIRTFHETQTTAITVVETMHGVSCWRKQVGIEKVGLYIPGGTAPLFSTILMLGIPAAIAGCKKVILCTPPAKTGKVHPAILFAAKLVGITNVFKIGGVQAIGAMAYGTATVPKVYKIFGPGNQYVTCAKQLVQLDGVAIDMPAGPSEVAIYADDTAVPAFVAADLLSQAEHGSDSQVLLVATSKNIIEAVEKELDKQLEQLPRKEIAAIAMNNSTAVVIADHPVAMDLLNEYAPEHLILATDCAEQLAEQVINAGSVFMGHYSPESVGDYASGTNHTLPTNGFAKMYSGVSVDSFVKKITYQRLSTEGLINIGNTVALMAAAEGLDAHARAVTIRLDELKS
ncbi:histidinol dehydrogenase [Gynurincola endophyticus]|uniref:histidinol dehydrogenase n=1 Tax=Gynurincola endophyticus TaxID=2479004 RepID=UPI000F8DF9D9|nr:histidinol dehydrogenase [Gynurincola endophyticus]